MKLSIFLSAVLISATLSTFTGFVFTPPIIVIICLISIYFLLTEEN